MKNIKLKGYVGWDITARDLERQLPTDGSDAEIEVDSFGGSVYEGNRLYNVILDHVKNKSTGKLTVVFGAVAASAASYFPLAVGVDNIGVRENTTFMGHKAWAFMLGNADELREEADILDGFDRIIANTYAKLNGNKSSDEYLAEMSREMWFIGGQNVIDAGFASFMVDNVGQSNDSEEDEVVEKSVILARIEEGKNKLRENGVKEDLEKWAACVKSELVNFSKSAPLSVEGNIETEEFENMKWKEFLNKNPEAKAEYEEEQKTANEASVKAVDDAKSDERKLIVNKLVLGGIKLSKDLSASIESGESLNAITEREIQARKKELEKDENGGDALGDLSNNSQVPEDDKESELVSRHDAAVNKRLGKKNKKDKGGE